MMQSCSKDQLPEVSFYENYSQYKQEGFNNRRFNQEKILPIIQSLKNEADFSVKIVGSSVLGKEISLISFGSGKTSVLLWSQMHGDESTATMALLDVFNFLKASDSLNAVRQLLSENLTLHFIPMLNPDGAEVFKRRNALDIDLNRDALRLQSPEAKILKDIRDSVNADFGFNLHDQNTRYTAGKSDKPATISFLAPAFDEAKSINNVRENAMKLIVEMNDALQRNIPGQVAKYSDEFEPRAFGDNIQKWGTSTVLIESGGYPDDPQKQHIRKLNFVAIMEGLLSIATQTYTENKTEDYFNIPNNEIYLYDLLIRNAIIEVNGEDYRVDLGINRAEVNTADHQDYYYKSTISDMGDLSVFYGYETFDARGMKAIPGKIYADIFPNVPALNDLDIQALLKKGYTAVQIKNLPAEDYIKKFPMNIVKEGSKNLDSIEEDSDANFSLYENGFVRYAIINGFIYDIDTKENIIENTLIKR